MNRREHWLYQAIGANIRRVRMKAGVTQEEMAALLNRTRQNLANMEAGRQRIPIEHLIDIAGALEVRLAELLKGLQ